MKAAVRFTAFHDGEWITYRPGDDVPAAVVKATDAEAKGLVKKGKA